MSRDVAALVYSRMAGSMARKGVLAYFAERANDDGSGIWASKQRIANEIECSKQTVITTVKGLIADGLIRETGQHKTRNGYTVIYCMNLQAIAALPAAKREVEEVQIAATVSTGQKLARPELDRSEALTARGQAAGPEPSLNRPSDANASGGADAPARPTDPVKVMFDSGIKLLGEAGIPEPSARTLLGRWRRDHGTEAVITALGKAQREGAIDPKAFIEGCLRNGEQPRSGRTGTHGFRDPLLERYLHGSIDPELSLDGGELVRPPF